MCTLILMRKVFSAFPLVIASNRDEDPDRLSADPGHWQDRLDIYAPRDLVRGGTWIGTGRYGLFVGITNRDPVPSRYGCASRGNLVADALAEPSARAARDFVIRAFASSPFNGFHLAVADADEAFLLIGDGDRLISSAIPFGATVLTAYGTKPSHVPRAAEIERRIAALQRRDEASPEALEGLLNFHADGDPRSAACVHDPRESHRTMSSMVIRADRDWFSFEHWYRRGPACSGPLIGSVRTVISQARRMP